MSRPPARSLFATSVLLTVLLSTTGPSASAATFGPMKPAAPPYSWNPGKALAATDRVLVSAWATDCPPPKGACATETGPFMGVYVQRSPAGAVPPAWTTPVRVSPGGVHAERATLAARGKVVVVGWVTQASYLRYDPGSPRAFGLRVSRSDGRTWRAPVPLSPARGRVDYPRVAVAAGRIYAVWTNADTGAVRLAISPDRGTTWTTRSIGVTTATANGPREGFAGLPDIGAAGGDVAIVWIADPTGRQVVLTSSSGGDDLGPTSVPDELTATSPTGRVQYPGAGGAALQGDGRVAVAYPTDGGVAVRTFDGSTLGPPVQAIGWPTVVDSRAYVGGYGPAVLPVSNDGLLLAVAACRRNAALTDPCDPLVPGARIDVMVTGSTDGGATWSAPDRLTDAAAPYKVNDEPSLAATGAVTRVAYDRYQSSFVDYRVWMRSGT